MPVDISEVINTAQFLTSPGRGILASDESTGTIGKRLAGVCLENTEEVRRDYREVFFTADGIGEYLSGAILFKETLAQHASDGTPFVDCLKARNVLAGIKVDDGLEEIPGLAPETHTKGLEGLADRCSAYYSQGARFSKWRAAIRVGDSVPSMECAVMNAEELAEYAAVSQAAGLCPIVEPELLIEGSHSAQRFGDASQMVIAECTKALWAKGVTLEGCLLKPQMVIPGQAWPGPKPSPEDTAQMTLDMLRRVVPAAIPGVMFLSGGQSEEEATVNLDALNRTASAQGRAPWALSFSYGRALQASVLKLFAAGKTEEAQAMAVALARANSMARRGAWVASGEAHPAAGGGSLVETFRGHTAH